MYKVALQSPRIKKQKSPQSDRLVPNLSQLYIQIPKPQFYNKISSVNHTQGSQQLQFQHHYYPSDDEINRTGQNMGFSYKVDSNQFIFSNTKTKNSISSASKNYRSENEIIKDWVKNMFHKRNLLGVSWQQRLRKKKRCLLRQAFECIKQQNASQSQSIYLQTQSKHKSYLKKDHHLVEIALQTLRGLNKKFQFKIQRQAFSMILRYLIFKPHRQELKESRIIYQSISPPQQTSHHLRSPKSIKLIHSNNINIQIYNKSDKQETKIKPITFQYANEQIKKQQIRKSMFLVQNQYSLNPLSPKAFKSDKFHQSNQHFEVKAKEKGSYQQQNVVFQSKQVNNPTIRYSPNPHNMFFEHNHHNHGPQTPKKMTENYICAPLTPKRLMVNHLQSGNNQVFTPKNHYQQVNQHMGTDRGEPMINKAIYKDINSAKKRQELYLRDSNYKRPNSHNPFANIIHQPIIHEPIEADHFMLNSEGLRKSRSISLTGNMKVSFIDSNSNNKHMRDSQQHNLINHDYQDNHNKVKLNSERLIGLQNKKIREGYQKNSCNNQLIQEHNIGHHNKPYVQSNPISPRYHDHLLNQLNEQQYYYVKSQEHQHQQASPRAQQPFGRHSFLPPNERERQQQKNQLAMRKSMQINNHGQNLGKRIGKDKLAITKKMLYN